MIISVGYRVNSIRGVQFRMWATSVLREYLIKGFAMNDALLKNAGGGNYFDELLSRIRDIRSSEKVFYRKVLEIYALSIDYDPRAELQNSSLPPCRTRCTILYMVILQQKSYTRGPMPTRISWVLQHGQEPFLQEPMLNMRRTIFLQKRLKH